MKTTLHIRNDILSKISIAANRSKTSRSEIIKTVLNKVMHDIKYLNSLGRMVKYQKKSDPDQWHRFHIKLSKDEYEYFLDLRKVLKKSVSLILAYAVKKYLKVILKKKSGDNYRYSHYSMSLEILNGLKIWRLIWRIASKS